jgi:hypothetical protein
MSNVQRYSVSTWFERDRAHVMVTDNETNTCVVDWWDDAVREMIEDGFFEPKEWEGSVLKYCHMHNILKNPNSGMPD